MEEKKFLVYTDGGARGNPGPAGIGIVIKCKTQSASWRTKLKTVLEFSKYIGEATNNQAEYIAVIKALEWLKFQTRHSGLRPQDDYMVECYLDSQLIVEQLNGRYKIKNEGLKPLYGRARDLIMELGDRVSFHHIPREQNQEADKLVNVAIDKHKFLLL